VIAIAGESAALLGEQLVRAGGPPLTVEADRFAFLSDDLDPPKAGRVRDLPESCVDLCILRRAWHAPGEVTDAIVAARRVVRPGGEVAVVDVSADRLLSGPSPRYPVRLLYLAEPAVGAKLVSSTASAGLLGSSAVRGGLSDLEGYSYDDVHGEYEDVSALWAGIRERGWRGSAWIDSERSRSLFDDVAPALEGAIPLGHAVDREPWYGVIGRVD
jgi:hypothetical protein